LVCLDDVLDELFEGCSRHIVEPVRDGRQRVERLPDCGGIGCRLPAGISEFVAPSTAEVDAEALEHCGGPEVGGHDVANSRLVQKLTHVGLPCQHLESSGSAMAPV
jgi:hypothetical protein